MWKLFRILVLLLILAKAIAISYAESTALNWQNKLYVAVYPINAEHETKESNNKVSTHISSLTNEDFEAVTNYFTKEAARYHLGLPRPIELVLANTVNAIPPEPPNPNNVLEVMFWSLQFRAYAWLHSNEIAFQPDIKMYLVYHDPDTNPSLSISTALNKGRIGRINLYGQREYHQKNLVVLAHELLHTLSAKDKYDLHNNLPQYPDGFAEPNKKPLYPQQITELMGGRLPISQEEAEMPENLNETIIGKQTAKEIGWLKG